jgi:hypothetical protein
MMTLSSFIKYQVLKKLLIPSTSVSSPTRDMELDSKIKRQRFTFIRPSLPLPHRPLALRMMSHQ